MKRPSAYLHRLAHWVAFSMVVSSIAAAQLVDKRCDVFFGVPDLQADCLLSSVDLAFDPSGNIWVLDEFRLLRFPKSVLPLTRSSRADIVIGRDDFQAGLGARPTFDPADPSSFERTFFGMAGRIQFDVSGALWIGGGSNRVFRFLPPFESGMLADFSFELDDLTDMVFDRNGALWIASRSPCTRILRFSPPFSELSPADLVIGQPDLETCLPPRPGPNRVGEVWGMAFDGEGRLFVGDNNSTRLLVFEPPFQNFMDGSVAIGQNDLTSFEPLPFEEGGLAFLVSLEFDFAGQLWVLHNENLLSVYAPPFETGARPIHTFNFAIALNRGGFRRFHFAPDWSVRLVAGNVIGGGEGIVGLIAQPITSPPGIVSAASFESGAMSPGELLVAFGVQLGFPGGLSARVENGRISKVLGKTAVTVDGIEAAVLFANDTQINFQVPFDLEPTTSAAVQVLVSGLAGPPAELPTADVSPGIFVLPGGSPALVNHAGQIGTLTQGEFGVLFAGGLGRVQGQLETADVTPLNPLLRTQIPVRVFLDEIECDILFAGLTPGFVSLYQVNFLVPESLPRMGEYRLFIRQSGTDSRRLRVDVQ